MSKNFLKKLMIVAHPDDESLFGGAQLITEDNWKVICVTNGDNQTRRKEFENVMYITGSDFEMWDYMDQYHIPLDEKRLILDLKRVLDEPWEKVVTHNEHGDYGHPHHKQLHFLIKNIRKDIWTFNFLGKKLPDDVWEAKLDLINVYESQREICKGHIPNVRNEQITKYKIGFI
jgi:LmbE family N-acetylglucosaminyl deacetylase